MAHTIFSHCFNFPEATFPVFNSNVVASAPLMIVTDRSQPRCGWNNSHHRFAACMLSVCKLESVCCLCRALAKQKRLAEGCGRPFAASLIRARGRALVVAPRFP